MSALPATMLVITDRAHACLPLVEVVAAAMAAGCRWVLVREKDLPHAALCELVADVVALASPVGAAVSVSAHADVAVASGAQGVHLPSGDEVARAIGEARNRLGADALVGVSVHSWEQAERAATAGASYVTLSPIFPTASKQGYGPALGLDELRVVSMALPIPVVALGGVTAGNAAACLRAGAAGVAVMGAIMRSANPGGDTAAIMDAVRRSRSRGAITEIGI